MARKREFRKNLEPLTFKTFLLTLTVAKIKELIDQYNEKFVINGPKNDLLKGYTTLKKLDLVEFVDSSLSEAKKNEMRAQFEPDLVEKVVSDGLSLISGEHKTEKIQNTTIIAEGKGYNIWFSGKYGSHKASLQLNKDSVERDCNCKIGIRGGLCLHQMAIYLMLISKKIIEPEELPFKVDEDFITTIEKRLNLLATQRLFKEEPSIMFEDDYKFYIHNDLVTLDWSGDYAGKSTKDISQEEEDFESWVCKKVVDLILKRIKIKKKTGKPTMIILDSYDVITKIMKRSDLVEKILRKFSPFEDLPHDKDSLEIYLKREIKETTSEIAIEPPFTAYMGENPYIFVSYAHKDKAEVYPILDALYKNGFRIWYDEGIPLSTDWCDTIAEKLLGCKVFLSFISPFVMESDNAQDEIHLAMNEKKPYIAVYLNKTKLTPGLKMRIGRIQGIMKYEMVHNRFQEKLISDLKSIF